jgi:diguanylate cyclase (GGDEF)-like protein
MQSEATETFAGARVLLVDDDLVLRDMATQTLQHAGFAVTAATNGEEALRLCQHEKFDLALLDVMMPGLDGFEVCTRLRQLPHGATLPILMLTGLNDAESVETAFSVGATDFVTKPINWTLLTHRVRYSLRASNAAENAARGRQRLASAQRLAKMGSWEWTPATSEFHCSEQLSRIFTGDESLPSLQLASFLSQTCEADRNAVRRLREAAATRGNAYEVKFGIQRGDGQPATVFEQAIAIRDAAGEVIRVEGITHDITEREEAERRIHQLAFYDSVTGLPNRRFFGEMAPPVMERMTLQGSVCAVLHLDLDHFKSVNDAFGQEGGDRCLRIIAERLQAATRPTDLSATIPIMIGAVPEILARAGGNAFNLLLVDLNRHEDAAFVATRLMREVARPIVIDGREALLTASVGVALSPRDAGNIHELSQKAEQALYAAKAAGRATHRYFDESMTETASGKLAMGSDLRRCISGNELQLYFQPKVNAQTGAMIGAEALVRWRHPKRGLIAPAEFIPLAEELGLIVPLGDWVLNTACELLARWRLAGTAVPLSINLSSPSFIRDGLIEHLDSVLTRCKIQPKDLTIEVTESVLMTNTELTIERLQILRERGIGLSLDDFGTGYSSLSYLKMLPLDELKIDRSFVQDVGKGGRGAALVGSIIALGQQFGLNVVAEGVETKEQAEFLLARGCPHQQGYLFARPMPLEQFDAVLNSGVSYSLKPAQAAA